MSHPARSTLEPPDYDGHFVMIPLTKGKFAIVDEADAEMVLGRGKWFAAQHRQLFYASRGERGRTVAMHAVVAGFERPDHVNRNGLDNRRINLRAATVSQNNGNIGLSRHNTSGYKGVSWDRERRKWMALINDGGRKRTLGRFDDPAEAACAYNAAALEKWGEFAWLNPVQTPCGTGWVAVTGKRNVPPMPRGATGVVLRALAALGEEAATGEIRRAAAREGDILSGRRVQAKLLELAARRQPLVEQTKHGYAGRGLSSMWQITSEGRAIVVGSRFCGVGWPTVS